MPADRTAGVGWPRPHPWGTLARGSRLPVRAFLTPAPSHFALLSSRLVGSLLLLCLEDPAVPARTLASSKARLE